LWPSHIPGAVPLAVRGIGRFNTFEDDRTTTFEFPHEFEVLTDGTLGETFSFFGELEIENEANENELGMGLMLQYDPRPWLHVRMGSLKRLAFSNGAHVDFDLLAYVPPHRPPKAIRDSGLIDESGWMSVDRHTLQTRWPNVYAIGDIVSIPLTLGKPLPKGSLRIAKGRLWPGTSRTRSPAGAPQLGSTGMVSASSRSATDLRTWMLSSVERQESGQTRVGVEAPGPGACGPFLGG